MLDELQRKAEAADVGNVGTWFSVEELGCLYGRDAAYIASASPDVVLRLIAVARAAKAAMDSTRPATEARSDWAALRESLAALEAVGKKEGMDKQ